MASSGEERPRWSWEEEEQLAILLSSSALNTHVLLQAGKGGRMTLAGCSLDGPGSCSHQRAPGERYRRALGRSWVRGGVRGVDLH